MGQVRTLDIRKIKEGSAMLAHFFGKNVGMRDPWVWAQQNMHDALREELPTMDKALDMPEVWETATVNKTRYKDLPSKRMYGEIAKLDIGNLAVFAAGPATAVTPLIDVLSAIRKMLHKESPKRGNPKAGGKRTPPGTYRKSHMIFYNGKRFVGGSVEQQASDYGEVFSSLDYASTLETPDYTKPYTTVMGIIARRRMWWDEYDITMTFADPKHFGGMIYTSNYKEGKLPVYAIPVITVAPLNSLPRRMKGNLMYKKRRSLKQRRNPVAIRRQIQKGYR